MCLSEVISLDGTIYYNGLDPVDYIHFSNSNNGSYYFLSETDLQKKPLYTFKWPHWKVIKQDAVFIGSDCIDSVLDALIAH